MDIYFTIEEKYLQAVEEYQYGTQPKTLKLLNEIIDTDAKYARAHYLLGKVHYNNTGDYQSAGYHYQTCLELEPSFPDAYVPYLRLLLFLNKHTLAQNVSSKALQVPGVQHSHVYEIMGQLAEKNNNWVKAARLFREALLSADDKEQVDDVQEHIERIELKIQTTRTYAYNLS
ncbi:hypothetical protein C8P68_10851 [Mucilaginibacter yixingensis]|uniref:Uncharacterized protein n=1 Tax=Mucilaginibacter yixingensis TaxID=1295612 RepID=A0A2T5J5P9_9SPHI|nr:hypothetical protein [Mucilaginibacter yixingensis]PTQ93589.1 hypothetical protein C8P68_10851 [Mucilaginibacter yixingensis]